MNRKHLSLSLRSTAYQRGGIAAGSRRYTGDGHVIRGGEKDTLEMARFPGGFFDNVNRPYYYVNDYRGSVSAVMKSDGRIEHSYDYYPYGELWVEPQIKVRPTICLSQAY